MSIMKERLTQMENLNKELLLKLDVKSKMRQIQNLAGNNLIENEKYLFKVQHGIIFAVQSDNGTEFLNGSFQSLLKSRGVRHITVNVGDHNRQGLIERFNRTLEGIIALYQESRKSNRYVNVLEDIVFNYNHTYHRGVDDVPEARYRENPSIGSMKVKAIKHSIKVRDRVRILKEKQTFRKGYESKYSNSIYTVVSGNGYSYSIADDEGEILQKTYKYYELQRIESAETFATESKEREHVLTNKQRRNKRELEELSRIREPANKKRKVFEGTYFL